MIEIYCIKKDTSWQYIYIFALSLLISQTLQRASASCLMIV